MRFAWGYSFDMAVMVQIRNVPDAWHRELKSRAAMAGMSLSEYLLAEIGQSLERPTLEELRKRLAQLPRVAPRPTPAQIIRRERSSH